MNWNRSIFTAAVGLTLAVGVIFAGCSKNKTTNPNRASGCGSGATLNISLAASGGTGCFTFNGAGTFPYKCGIHPTVMFGDTVKVDPNSTVADANVAVVGVSTPGFNPATVTVKVGGTVHWTNPTGAPHSVVNN